MTAFLPPQTTTLVAGLYLQRHLEALVNETERETLYRIKHITRPKKKRVPFFSATFPPTIVDLIGAMETAPSPISLFLFVAVLLEVASNLPAVLNYLEGRNSSVVWSRS